MLTPHQKQILDFVTHYNKRYGVSPALEEIKRHFRLKSVSGIHQHIETLKNKGYLNKAENQPRGIEITMREEMIKILIAGTIAAGQPIEAIEIPDETIAISKKEIIPSEKHYALRVQGDSMINEGIFDGDVVVIRKQTTADDGQTVVAIIDDNEATLKKIYREKGRFRLQPANQTILPI